MPNTPSSSQNTLLDHGSDTRIQTVADILLAQQLITDEQYKDAKVKSAQESKTVDDIIEASHIVPEDKLTEAKAKVLGVPFISLANASFSPQALSLLPRAVVERFNLIPFFYDDKTKTLSIAMSNPVDLEALSFIRQKTGLTIKSFEEARNRAFLKLLSTVFLK